MTKTPHSTPVHPLSVTLRDLLEADLPQIMDYWYRSPSAYLESIAVDPARLPPEDAFAANLRKLIVENRERPASQLHALAIECDRELVGFHTVFPVTLGESAVFHAHLVRPEMRRRGIALCSYAIAANVLIPRFWLKRLLYKTPLQNAGPIRVKEKLGIRAIGEERIDLGIVKPGTLARVYELLPDEARGLPGRLGYTRIVETARRTWGFGSEAPAS